MAFARLCPKCMGESGSFNMHAYLMVCHNRKCKFEGPWIVRYRPDEEPDQTPDKGEKKNEAAAH